MVGVLGVAMDGHFADEGVGEGRLLVAVSRGLEPERCYGER